MAQRYEKLVQEDLNVGTEAVWVTAPGGGELRATQIGIHTVARGQVAYEAAWTPGSIAGEEYATTTFAVPDAAIGDMVLASHDKMSTGALRISGHVSVAGTVKVVIHNPTLSAVTVAAGTVRVLVFPFTGTATPDTGDVTGTVYFNIIGGVAVGAGVAVALVADGLSTVTDANGEYSLSGATPGLATVSADDGGGQTGNNTGTVTAGGTVAIDIAISGV